jgi:hypothetical protein
MATKRKRWTWGQNFSGWMWEYGNIPHVAEKLASDSFHQQPLKPTCRFVLYGKWVRVKLVKVK